MASDEGRIEGTVVRDVGEVRPRAVTIQLLKVIVDGIFADVFQREEVVFQPALNDDEQSAVSLPYNVGVLDKSFQAI